MRGRKKAAEGLHFTHQTYQASYKTSKIKLVTADSFVSPKVKHFKILSWAGQNVDYLMLYILFLSYIFFNLKCKKKQRSQDETLRSNQMLTITVTRHNRQFCICKQIWALFWFHNMKKETQIQTNVYQLSVGLRRKLSFLLIASFQPFNISQVSRIMKSRGCSCCSASNGCILFIIYLLTSC